MPIKDLNNLSDDELAAIAGVSLTPKGVAFKNQAVSQEFNALDPALKAVAETAPMGGLVTSGARSPQENAMVGGVSNSAHLGGKAIDYRIDENTPEREAYYKGLGMKAFVHGKNPHLHVEGTPDLNKMSDAQLMKIAGIDMQAAKADPNAKRPPMQMGAGEASLRGAASAVPLSGVVSGAMRTLPQFRAMADAFGGNFDAAAGEYQKGFLGFDPSQFSKGRSTFNVKEEQAAQDQPVAYTLTKLAAELPQYLAGAEALKAVPALSGSGMMSGIGRSALSNVGVSQVHDYAPEQIPEQLAVGAGGEVLARGAGAALKGAGKLGQFMRFREPGIGGKIAEYGFQPTATGLKNANVKEMEKWVPKMEQLLASKPSAEVPLPKGITGDSVRKIASKIEASGFGGEVEGQANILKTIADQIEIKGALNPADSHLLKKSMDELAYAERGLRNTTGAKQLNGWARNITKNIEDVVGKDYKTINSNLEKTAKIGKQFKTVSTEGVDSKAAFKKSIMPGVLEGGLLTGATVSNPIVSAPAYTAYKLLQTAPVFTVLPAAGRFADQTGPALGAIINEIMAAARR